MKPDAAQAGCSVEVRDARFDVLRMLAMYMIVVGHFVNHGIRFVLGGESPDVGFSDSMVGQVNFVLCQFLGYATNVGPNLFFLMTGFFLVKPHGIPYTVKKAFRLWGVMVVYGVVCYGLALAGEREVFCWWTLFTQFLPIHENTYWFMTVYVGVLLLSPFLARVASVLTKCEYGVLLLVLLLMNFGQENFGYGVRYSGGMSLFFGIFLFLVGGYVKLHPINGVRRWWCVGYLVLCLCMTAISVVGQMVLHNTEFLHVKALANNSLPLFSSICLFLWFAALPPMKSSWARWAVKVSPYILSVYLIHENVFVRTFLWNEVVRPTDYIDKWWLVPYGLSVSILVMVLCVAVDVVRHRILRGL